MGGTAQEDPMTARLTIEEARAAGALPGRRKRKEVTTEAALLQLLREMLESGSQIRLEHRFDPSRRWRADIADLTARVIIEIDGGGWARGRHHRAEGRRRDNERDAAAQAQGWRVLRVDWAEVRDGTAIRRWRALQDYE
jgi:very-short-patch-repair endonuclease